MPPVRRYLRLTSHTVLEVRIYLENPADAGRWLIRPSEPALPRIIAAIRPLVLPKLREENERAKRKGKGRKKGSVKDVVTGDDFDVSIFLTPRPSSRHSIMRREKVMKGEHDRIGTVGGRMTGTQADPMQIRDPDIDEGEDINLAGIPPAQHEEDDAVEEIKQEEGDDDNEVDISSDEENPEAIPANKIAGQGDDKKKLGFNTTYDGFSIYSRILCLFVKRKGSYKGREVNSGDSSQAMMEGWIASTQAKQDAGLYGD